MSETEPPRGPADALHTDRARAESFGSVAADYDRYRPSYPAALVDDLAALHPRAVLDVGCGTGKVATLLAGRGLDVLGVEADARMAGTARSHGLTVEVAGFEDWDARGRRFDLITCGQAWHWIDHARGIAKAAGLLDPGGTFTAFWNADQLDPTTRAALAEVYATYAPELTQSVVLGGNRHGEAGNRAELLASGRFAAVTERTYRWARQVDVVDWVAMTGTHSDHLRLPAERRQALLSAAGAALRALGDTVAAEYETYAVVATVAGS